MTGLQRFQSGKNHLGSQGTPRASGSVIWTTCNHMPWAQMLHHRHRPDLSPCHDWLQQSSSTCLPLALMNLQFPDTRTLWAILDTPLHSPIAVPIFSCTRPPGRFIPRPWTPQGRPPVKKGHQKKPKKKKKLVQEAMPTVSRRPVLKKKLVQEAKPIVSRRPVLKKKQNGHFGPHTTAGTLSAPRSAGLAEPWSTAVWLACGPFGRQHCSRFAASCFPGLHPTRLTNLVIAPDPQVGLSPRPWQPQGGPPVQTGHQKKPKKKKGLFHHASNEANSLRGLPRDESKQTG